MGAICRLVVVIPGDIHLLFEIRLGDGAPGEVHGKLKVSTVLSLVFTVVLIAILILVLTVSLALTTTLVVNDNVLQVEYWL